MRIRSLTAAWALATACVTPFLYGQETAPREFTVGPVKTLSDRAASEVAATVSQPGDSAAAAGQPGDAAAAPGQPGAGAQPPSFPVYGNGAYGALPAPWHAGYYHTAFGRPVPLVVPPTATYQTNWGWGIGNTRVTPIYPQFAGPYAGYGYEGAERWQPTPYWTTDTLQFGVYYIRGPYGDNQPVAYPYTVQGAAGQSRPAPEMVQPGLGYHIRHLQAKLAAPAGNGQARPSPEATQPGIGVLRRSPYRQGLMGTLKMR